MTPAFWTAARRAVQRWHRGLQAWWRGRRADHQAHDLAAECGDYLQGRLADRQARRGESVSPWAWTNLLAHGTSADLARERDARRYALGGDAGFVRARAVLAGRVLEMVAAGDRLDQLQRELLQPLESELARRSDVELWGPEQWLASVLRVLDEHSRRPLI